MKKTLMTKLFVVLAGAASIVGCGKSMVPTGPSSPGPISSGEFTLTGRVSGPSDGGMTALEGVTVMASNGAVQGSTVSDPDGNFAIGGLSAGEWTILLSKTGYADQSEQVTVSGDTSVNYSLETDQLAALKHLARARRK